MIKKLTRQGNSSALIIDKAVMNLMDITDDTPLKVTVKGRRLIVEPLTKEQREDKFKKVTKRTSKRNAEVFKRLAK